MMMRNPISLREAQVAFYVVVEGLRAKEVAERLQISHRTVEHHLYRLYNKISRETIEENKDWIRRRKHALELAEQQKGKVA